MAVDTLHNGLGLVRGEAELEPTVVFALGATYSVYAVGIAVFICLFVATIEQLYGRRLHFALQCTLGSVAYLLGAALLAAFDPDLASLGPSSGPDIAMISCIVLTAGAVAIAGVEDFRERLRGTMLERAALRACCLGLVLVFAIGLLMWQEIAPNAVRDLQRYGKLGGASYVFDIDSVAVESEDGDRAVLLAMAGPVAVLLRPSCSDEPANAIVERTPNVNFRPLDDDAEVCVNSADLKSS